MIHIGGTYEVAGYDHVGGSLGCFAFIPADDIYDSPEKAEEASINDDYDDKTSNKDWQNVVNNIIKLWDSTKKMEVQIDKRDETKNTVPKKVIIE